MNTFAVLFLCIQACLVQNIFGQCLGVYSPAAAITPGFASAGIAPAFATALVPGLAPFGWSEPCNLGAYGGAGEGNVAVAGELPVCGSTAVAGQVPIMGAVRFGGDVCAAGAVSIAGNCACGCGY